MGAETFLYKNTNHVSHLNNMRLSGKLCDVTIQVNDKKFQAHKIILAANLRYFESMFLNDFQESKQDVTMQGVDETDLETFITYAYTGEILLTDTNALNLLELANYLTEDGIKESCIKFLQENLKKEEACRAYNLASAIECCSLKSVARKTILSNLENCSLTTEYLSLNFENLKDILNSANLDFVQSRQVLFEGAMKWILQNTREDTSSRRSYISDFFNLIDISKLSTDYLWKYFSKRIDNQGYRITFGFSDIIKDIMFLYNTKSQQICQSENLRLQLLMIAGVINDKLHVQFYNFTEKTWSQPHEIIYSKKDWYSKLAILDNTFYQITSKGCSKKNCQVYLHSLDHATKQYAIISSNRTFLGHSAMCACTEMLYVCGGLTADNSYSNQVISYDPRTRSLKAISPINTERAHAAAVFYQGYLHVLGGYDEHNDFNLVEKYNPATKEWTALPSMNEKRYCFEVAVFDGKLYACGGGSSSKSVEFYDSAKNSWQLVANMNKDRFNFLLLARGDKLLAIGGDDEKTVEVYDPSKNQWQVDGEMSSKLQIKHPGGGFISSMDS